MLELILTLKSVSGAAGHCIRTGVALLGAGIECNYFVAGRRPGEGLVSFRNTRRFCT